MAQIKFVGGPHDGLTLTSGLGVAFLFTDGKRCFRAPSRDRSLYKSRQRRGAARTYAFVGNTHTLCVCGGFRRKLVACAMCGAGG